LNPAKYHDLLTLKELKNTPDGNFHQEFFSLSVPDYTALVQEKRSACGPTIFPLLSSHSFR
jgi:hypothetical protein